MKSVLDLQSIPALQKARRPEIVSLRYTHPLRRAFRAVGRMGYASTKSAVRAEGIVVPAYWWSYAPNFGDSMTPWILPNYGIVPVLTSAEAATFFGAGSVLQLVPPQFAGIVWGSGLIRDTILDLSGADVLAVRGHLTADCIGSSPKSFGDPGLISSKMINRPKTRWQVGLVPHHINYHDKDVREFVDSNPCVRLIDVQQSPARVVSEIARCEMIVSSSLHGLIAADSFGIPAAWTLVGDGLIGGSFKFLDYESVAYPGGSRMIEFNSETRIDDLKKACRSADATVIQELADGLIEALSGARRALGNFPRFPWGIVNTYRK